MFGLVFSNKHIAQPFIEHLLDIKIDHLETRAKEDLNITLDDRTFKNFYIFKKYEEFTDPVVKAYMKYFATRKQVYDLRI